MSLLFSNIHNLYSPVDSTSGSGITTNDKVVDPKSESDIFNILNSENDGVEDKEIIPIVDKKIKKSKGEHDVKTESKEVEEDEEDDENNEDEEDEEDEDLDELEEELREPSEEELELISPVSRREILKKYPNLFKDFPYLQSAYYREQQFTQVFGMPEEAKAAKEKASLWDSVENQLGNGDISKILGATKHANPNAFNRIVDDLFSNIREIDENAYTHLIGNLSKQVIKSMADESDRSGDKNLRAAAAILNKFLFATTQYTEPSRLSKEEKEDIDSKKLTDERQQAIRERFEEVQTELTSRIESKIRRSIESYIDPKKSMTDYVRKHAVTEAIESLSKLMDKDKRFRGILDKMWDSALKSRFSKESVSKIESAYINRASTQLLSVIKTARQNALKGMGIRVRESDGNERDEKQDTTRGESKNRAPKREETARSQNDSKTKGIPKGMSTEEYFMSDSFR